MCDDRDEDKVTADIAKKIAQKFLHRDSWTEKQKYLQIY